VRYEETIVISSRPEILLSEMTLLCHSISALIELRRRIMTIGLVKAAQFVQANQGVKYGALACKFNQIATRVNALREFSLYDGVNRGKSYIRSILGPPISQVTGTQFRQGNKPLAHYGNIAAHFNKIANAVNDLDRRSFNAFEPYTERSAQLTQSLLGPALSQVTSVQLKQNGKPLAHYGNIAAIFNKMIAKVNKIECRLHAAWQRKLDSIK
jgi:hypothetical protein